MHARPYTVWMAPHHTQYTPLWDVQDPNAADYTNGFYWNSATCSIDDWKAYQAVSAMPGW